VAPCRELSSAFRARSSAECASWSAVARVLAESPSCACQSHQGQEALQQSYLPNEAALKPFALRVQTACVLTIASLHLLGWSTKVPCPTILLILLRRCSTGRNDDDTRANRQQWLGCSQRSSPRSVRIGVRARGRRRIVADDPPPYSRQSLLRTTGYLLYKKSG
jgi:hypothetical protein